MKLKLPKLNIGKKTNTEDVLNESPNDTRELTLLVLVERKLPSMQEFFNYKGINVTEIYDDIEEAKIGLLMQSGACRVVIIEAGLGKFTTTNMRAEISDLLGMCDGKEKRVTVFYTDSLIKSDNVKSRKDAGTDWVKYEGTMKSAQRILEYKEIYSMPDNYVAEKMESLESVMKIQGTEVESIENKELRPNMEETSLSELLEYVKETVQGESIKQFDVIY